MFESYLLKNDIPWPRLSSTELDLKTETFKEMALLYPEIAPLKELRSTLSQIRNNSLAIGPDGRNRCMLSPFKSKTGRNQPSNSEFIFGASSWSRSLIRPEKGFALAYIDWCQQEHGIAAFLSNDTNMIKVYKSGDPYLEFAKQAGSVLPDATKQSHRNERDLFKQTALAVQYGMGAESLARKIKSTEDKALWLLNLHRKTYPTFWKWSDSCLDFAGINGFLYTVFGWPVHIESDINIRSVRNFPMQANGAEMLRLACILLVKENIRVCATVHDAILIESKIEDIEATVKRAQALMAKASSVVLSGFKLKSDVKIVKYPDRFVEERGQFIWNKILNIIDEERCIESVTPSVRP